MHALCAARRVASAAVLLLASACRSAPARDRAYVSHPSPGLGEADLRDLRADLPRLSASEVLRRRSLGEKLALIDVRGPEERAKLRIAGSSSLPYYELQSRLDEVPRDRPVVLYCGGGACPLSRWSVQKLLDWGFTNVYELDGGIAEWSRRAYPTESGPEAGAGSALPKDW